MKARQVHFARGNEKVTMDQVNNPVRKVGREVGAIVSAAIFPKSAGDIDSRESLAQSELYVRISLIIAQQDVETRLSLLDEIVFERKRFFVVGDDDIVNIHRFAYQGSSFRVLDAAFVKIGSNPAAEVLGFADINNLALGVLVQIHAGRGRQTTDFGGQVHE